MILLREFDVVQIPKSEAINLKKGDVILVRSDYKPEKYGDHFSLIVGGKIQKQRGLRPNLVTFPPIGDYEYLLSKYQPTDGAIILKLSESKAQELLNLLELHLSEGDLVSI